METTKESLGERLGRLRKRVGITQEKLVELSKVPWRTIQNIEQGRTADPGIFVVDALAKAIKVSLEELVNGERPPEKKLSDMSKEEIIDLLDKTLITGKSKSDENTLLLKNLDSTQVKAIKKIYSSLASGKISTDILPLDEDQINAYKELAKLNRPHFYEQFQLYLETPIDLLSVLGLATQEEIAEFSQADQIIADGKKKVERKTAERGTRQGRKKKQVG